MWVKCSPDGLPFHQVVRRRNPVYDSFWKSRTGNRQHLGRLFTSFPGGSEVKVSACDAGDLGLIPRLGSSPGEGNGNPLQYSCLENPMDGGGLYPMGHKELDTTERLHFYFTFL